MVKYADAVSFRNRVTKRRVVVHQVFTLWGDPVRPSHSVLVTDTPWSRVWDDFYSLGPGSYFLFKRDILNLWHRCGVYILRVGIGYTLEPLRFEDYRRLPAGVLNGSCACVRLAAHGIRVPRSMADLMRGGSR